MKKRKFVLKKKCNKCIVWECREEALKNNKPGKHLACKECN